MCDASAAATPATGAGNDSKEEEPSGNDEGTSDDDASGGDTSDEVAGTTGDAITVDTSGDNFCSGGAARRNRALNSPIEPRFGGGDATSACT